MQGGDPYWLKASLICWKAVGGWPSPRWLQHSEGVYTYPEPASTWRFSLQQWQCSAIRFIVWWQHGSDYNEQSDTDQLLDSSSDLDNDFVKQSATKANNCTYQLARNINSCRKEEEEEDESAESFQKHKSVRLILTITEIIKTKKVLYQKNYTITTLVSLMALRMEKGWKQ